MNVVLETLFLRHPRFEYISPAICEAIFSSSGSPVIVLDPISKLLAPTGGVLGGGGAGRGSRIFWAGYPGVLCYSIWTASDPENPDSPYNLASECVSPHSIVLCSPGFYQVTAITADGETPKSAPIEVPGTGYVVIPLPEYPGTICYQLYKSFTIDGFSALYWSCFSGDGINVQTCGPCVKISVITAEGETPLSDPICPEEPCDIIDPEIGQELCGPLLDWDQALCACVPCEPSTPCIPGTHWDNTICQCVANGGCDHTIILSALSAPNYCNDVAYSGTITATDGIGPYTWTLLSGTLPSGFTFHGGGTNNPFVVIDGTTSEVGTFTFTVKCEDIDGCITTQEYTLSIPGVDWGALTWGEMDYVAGEPTYSFGPGGTYHIQSGVGPLAQQAVGAITTGFGQVLYTGSGCSCRATITVEISGTTSFNGDSGFVVTQDNVVIGTAALDGRPSDGPITYTVDFNVSAGVNSVIRILGAYNIGIRLFYASAPAIDTGDFYDWSVTFSNVCPV